MVDFRPAQPAFSGGVFFSGAQRPKASTNVALTQPADSVHFSGTSKPQPITLGSAPGCTQRVRANHVLSTHAKIRTAEDGTWLHAHGDTRVDDRLLYAGERYMVEPGDIITLGEYADDPSFLLTDNGVVPIQPETATMVRHLFPKGTRDIEIKQGGVDACTVLASMAGTAFNDPLSLIGAITPLYGATSELTGYEVKFPGGPSTVVALDDLESGATGTRGALAANLYEIAYAQAFLGRQAGESVIDKFQGGLYEDEVLHHMTGKEVTVLATGENSDPYIGRFNGQDLGTRDLKPRELSREFETALQKLASNPKKHLAIAGTRHWGEATYRYGGCKLQSAHAYAVVGADPDSQMIRLADPHHSGERFWMPWKDFQQYFRSLVYVS